MIEADDREGRFVRLAVERQGHLAPLPVPEPVRPEENYHTSQPAERLLQHLKPVEPNA
jgi:hypothetical protein